MRNYLLYLVMLVMGLACGVHTSAQQASAPPSKGVVRVKLQREVAARLSQLPVTAANGVVKTGIVQLDRANSQAKAVSIKRCVPYSPKYEARHKAAGLDLWYEVTFDENAISAASARNLYKSVPGVQKAEEVRPMKLIGDGKAHVVDVQKAAKAASADMPFNDPLLYQQWHYNNDGTYLAQSVAGADANVFKGWTVETGKKDVIVAIIDGGFQLDHPDLKDNVWVNTAEIPGNGTDDDGNGYTDDVNGYNFVTDNAEIYQHQHGTHVAGTVGATNGNGIGVCGVAGGSDGTGGVTMMACQVFDSRAENASANFGAALIYAADNGASIAQCSWGWDSPGYKEDYVLECIDYFTQYGGGDKMSGGLCIFANGNTGDEGEYYPGAYEPVVAVGAMDPLLHPASYSSRGTWCDVTAPGGDTDYGSLYGVLSTLPNGQYGTMDGTSMACPHVSGIAALILSKYGNPDFPNSTLRAQLTSSVNDFYTRNPEVEGLFGSGYIDAYKALQMGTGEAPQAVADFTLTPSQDNILIEWTIPDADVKSVDHHVIYYSTQPFTTVEGAADLKQVTVDTKFMTSGDPMQYTLEGLASTTTYYIAIEAVSRYGDVSALSPVKSATTNEGPKVTLSKTELSLTLDASQGGVAKDEFTINNTGKGILEYDITANTVKAPTASTYANGAPQPGRLAPASHTVQTYAAVSGHPIVTADYMAEDYPKEMTFSNGIYYYIGDSGESSTNALAQYFYVDPEAYPDGFNLTAIRLGGPGDSFHPTLEVYDGAQSISQASLLTSIKPDWFMYNSDNSLSEQLFFEPGSSFWLVAKFPAGETNPLGAGHANTQNVKQYSFYSSDNGQTWTQLSEVLREGNLAEVADSVTWDIYAISKNPDWSSVLSPEPVEGTVRPGESQTVTMQNDGQKMVNGDYTFNLNVNTNESDKPKQQLKVSMSVSGNKPELASAKMVDFGEMLVGQQKTLSVEIVNNGYGDFNGEGGMLQGSDIASSSEEFVPVDYHDGFSARSKGTLDVTFKPTSAGSKSATVTLTDKDGNKFSFVVRGVASMPAELKVDKDELDFGQLEVGGASKDMTFTIENTGQYPLEYVFPKFSDETIDGASSAHKYGYTYQSNIDGDDSFQYDGNPELVNETDITSQFSDYTWQSEPIDLGFQFPFYGENYSKVYVTSHGAVTMQAADGNIQCMVPVATCVQGLGYVSAYATSGTLQFGADSKVTYGRQDGKFTVKFKNVLSPSEDGGDNYVPISFHMSLSADGSVEVYYDDYDASKQFGPYGYSGGAYVFIGVSDVNCDDPFVVTDANKVQESGSTLYSKLGTGSAIRIIAPTKSMVSALSSTDGVVGVGEKKEITVTAKAVEGMYAGELVNQLTMLTNDPKNPGKNIVLKAEITGDGLVPEVKLDKEAVDFGEVFRTSTAKSSVLLTNNGTDDLTVKSIAVAEGKVKVDEELAKGFTVKPGYGKDIFITLPTDNEGAVEDNVTISFGDGTSKTIAVKGTVIGCPEVAVTPDALTLTTDCGANLNETLTVKNDGNEDLKLAVDPNDWFNVTNLETATDAEMDYQYKSKSDYDDVEYDWVDITDGTADAHQDFVYYIEKTDFYEAELPFEFTFYGKKYKKMYIYNTGFVSFSEHDDYKMFPEPPAEFPSTETFYTNIIAPFWGNHTMAGAVTDGTYYKKYDDHVVVSFINYANSAMSGMDFQLLLYADGRYKFQYRVEPNGYISGVYGLAGIQNETGEIGIKLPNQYIADGNAVDFYPVKTFTAPAGGSVEVPLEILADSLAGDYKTNIVLRTNVPTKPEVTVPLNLTINGEVDAVWPESVKGEDVANYMSDFTERYYDFEVANKGDKAFKITNAEYSDPSYQSSLLVYTTYSDPLMGGTTTGWTAWPMDYSTYQPKAIEIGREPLKMRIVVQDYGQPATFNTPVKFTVEGIDGMTEKEIPVDIKLTDAPALAVTPAEGLTFNVKNSTETTRGSFTIDNKAGKYKLTYSLRMDPTGVGETASELDYGGGGGIMMGYGRKADMTKDGFADLFKRSASIVPHDRFDGFSWDMDPDYEYSNILYYPMLDQSASPQYLLIGTGEDNLDNNFMAATRYTAPAEGFNLAKVYFVGTVGTLENVDIEAQVVQGSDVATGTVIGHGTLRVDKEEPSGTNPDTGKPSYNGVPRMLTLDKPVYINPADTFYVVLKYPAGYSASAGLVQKQQGMEPGRFMAYNAAEGWYDLGQMMYESYYSSFGYFMTCVEDEPGQPWIKLVDTPAEGEIAVGGEAKVNVEINPSSSYFDRDNKAVLVIKSNDPAQPVVNYPITLNKNAAPQVTLPEGTFTVQEGQTADMEVSVADLEGEAFTVSVSDADGIASIGTCTLTGGEADEAVEPVEGVISVPEGRQLKMTLTFAPDYGTAGSHTVDISVEDASLNANTVEAAYNVEFVNRAPVYEGDDEMTVYIGQTSGMVAYDAVFTDPEGQRMTYTAALSDTDVAELMTGETGFTIYGKAAGETQLTLTATDVHGAVTTQKVKVTVAAATGIGSVYTDKDISVSPNPVVDRMNVVLGGDADNVNYYVYDNAGSLVATAHADHKAAGEAQTIDMGACAPGVYRVKVTADGKQYNASVLKK